MSTTHDGLDSKLEPLTRREAGSSPPRAARIGARFRAALERGLSLLADIAGATSRELERVIPTLPGAGPRRVAPPGSAFATRQDIATAYRMILRRSPDPEGLRHYRRWVARGLTLDDLVGSLMNSDEYRKRIVPSLPAELRTGIRQRALAEDAVPVDLGGYTVCVRASDQDFGQAILATHDYEPHVRRFLQESLRTGQVVVDVGANVGCLCFQAARLVGAQGRVIAIEPNPDNVQLLMAGIVMNEWTNVEVWPCAAWDMPGIMSLKGGASNTYLVLPTPLGEGRAYAQLVRLDEALAHLDRIDLIKIDIEGHEPHAIRGARGLIEKHRPTLLTEFNPRCLREVGGVPPLAYAEQLLSHYSRLRVITAFGDDAAFRSADALMRYWAKRDREIARAALLPEGMLQFDVVATMD